MAKIFLYVQVRYPPPHVGYDHNWALFGLGMEAANKTHIGAISNECATLHLASQLRTPWPDASPHFACEVLISYVDHALTLPSLVA